MYKKMWQEVFEDTEEYVEYYFEHKFPVSKVYSDVENGELRAMALFTPYEVCYKGEVCTADYIVGVATDKNYRRQGLMSKLLRQGMEDRMVFLCPANPVYYEKLGFSPTYWRETTVFNTLEKESRYTVKKWSELEKDKKQMVVDFVEAKMKEESFELYMKRSIPYYDAVALEMQALEGDVLILFDGDAIVAVLNYCYEETEYIVTELIAERKKAEWIPETIAEYLKTDELTVEDSYFISHIIKKGTERKKQPGPYIMYHLPNVENSPVINCYINDIT